MIKAADVRDVQYQDFSGEDSGPSCHVAAPVQHLVISI
jgi:hypothetical protein